MLFNFGRIAVLAFTMFFVGLASAQAAEPVVTDLSWTEVFDSMRFEREKLVRGAYEASGERQHDGSTETIRIYCAFDFSQGMIRFEFQENPGSENETRRVIYDCPEYTLHWVQRPDSGASSIKLEPPGTMKSHGMIGSRGFLDIRLLGLLGYYWLYDGTYLDDAFSEWSSKGGDFVSVGEGVLKYTDSHLGGKQRLSMWVDTNQGVTISRVMTENGATENGVFSLMSEHKTRGIIEYLKSHGGAEYDDVYPDVASDVKVHWGERNGAYIPLACDMQSTELTSLDDNGDIVAPYDRMTLNFDWQSVNEPIEASLFDYHYFDFPRSTPVWDRRVKPKKLIELLKDIQKPKPEKNRYFLFLLVTSIGIAGLIAALRYRKRKKRRPS